MRANTSNGAPLGIVVTDPHGHIVDANHWFCALLGRDREWLRRHDMRDVLFPGEAASFHQTLESQGANWDSQTTRHRKFLTASGDVLTVDHTIGQLWNGGSPSGTVHYLVPEPEQLETAALEAGARMPVLIVSDDPSPLWRSALAVLLDRQPGLQATEALTISQLPSKLKQSAADVVVALIAKGAAGDEQAARLVSVMSTHAETGLVVVSPSASPQVLEALRTRPKATALIPSGHTDGIEAINRAVEAVAMGLVAVDPGAITEIVGAPDRSATSNVGRLSDREKQVLQLIANGSDNQAIAETLFVSVKAVENYVGTIFRKLELNDQSGIHRRVKAALMYLDAT